jgi:hypothetical protein
MGVARLTVGKVALTHIRLPAGNAFEIHLLVEARPGEQQH